MWCQTNVSDEERLSFGCIGCCVHVVHRSACFCMEGVCSQYVAHVVRAGGITCVQTHFAGFYVNVFFFSVWPVCVITSAQITTRPPCSHKHGQTQFAAIRAHRRNKKRRKKPYLNHLVSQIKPLWCINSSMWHFQLLDVSRVCAGGGGFGGMVLQKAPSVKSNSPSTILTIQQ